MNSESAFNPLVTVVIPSYNRAQYIGETIESVFAQTYYNIEIIVIDDGSTDNTEEAVAKYVPRVRYVKQENAERGASRNHGLRLANGEFIVFLDSDDLLLPDKIEEDLILFKENPSIGLVYTDILIIDAEGNPIKQIKRPGYAGKITEKLLEDNFISIGAHLIRTQLVRDIGGFREERQLSGSEDWEMWVRLSTITEFAYLSRATAKIRTHLANTMNNAEGMSRSMNYALDLVSKSKYLNTKQKLLLGKTKAYMSLINAINYCSSNEKEKTLFFLKEAFVNNPKITFDYRFSYTILRLVKSYLF